MTLIFEYFLQLINILREECHETFGPKPFFWLIEFKGIDILFPHKNDSFDSYVNVSLEPILMRKVFKIITINTLV